MGSRRGGLPRLPEAARLTRAESVLRAEILRYLAVTRDAERRLSRARDKAVDSGVGPERVAQIARSEGVGE